MNYGSLFNNAIQGQAKKETGPPSDIEITLECTLEEFYCGCMKEINFQRGVVMDNARSLQQEFVS